MLGVDIGGSGIKGAIIDLETGKFLTERLRIPTPSPATPKAVAKVFNELVQSLDYSGPIGCGFPAIVRNGVAMSASNIDDKWINTNISDKLGDSVQQDVFVANDADVAGLAEMKFGVGTNPEFQKGTILLITIGTGLGSALFHNGSLVPNSELGHIQLKGMIAEHYASNKTRKEEDLGWKTWGTRLNTYLRELNKLFSPNAIILGGGGSKHFKSIKKHLDVDTNVLPAKLGNHAGIIGAALYANEHYSDRSVSLKY